MSHFRTFLAGATTMASALAAVFVLTGARDPGRQANFDEITVGRINVVEPDGTRRLIISNRAQFPGAFHEGKEIARPDRRTFAGMLFINEEGTENGGRFNRSSQQFCFNGISRRIKCHELAGQDYHLKKNRNFGIDGRMVSH